MLLALSSALVAGACALASTWRLRNLQVATYHHPGEAAEALARGGAARAAAIALMETAPEESWERSICAAAATPSGPLRDAMRVEQELDLDYALLRWGRVPRVCASLSTSAGFMIASLLLRDALMNDGVLGGDIGLLLTQGPVGEALAVAGFGLAGALYCGTFHGLMAHTLRRRRGDADRIVAAVLDEDFGPGSGRPTASPHPAPSS